MRTPSNAIATARRAAAPRSSLFRCASLLIAIALGVGACKAESKGPAPIKVPATAVAVTAPLEVGRPAYVEWNGDWFAAKVLKDAGNGKVKIHYVGWEDQWDEEVAFDRIKIDAP